MANFPSYTKCVSPGGFSSPVATAVVLGTFTGILTVSTLTVLISSLVGGGGASALGPLFLASSIAALISAIWFCRWWLYGRLICLGGDQSATGVIYARTLPTPPYTTLEPPETSDNAFEFGDYDTDYSFDLLLSQFTIQEELPLALANNIFEWPVAPDSQMQNLWPPEYAGLPLEQVPLILAQSSMSGLTGLVMTGQNSAPVDEPPPNSDNTNQHFLLHSEIEGAGMHNLVILLYVLLGILLLALAAYFIPVVGPVISIILTFLVWLAFLIGGPLVQQDSLSPADDPSWGGSVNMYDPGGSPTDTVDIVVVYGRWVYDSFHNFFTSSPRASNELHPVYSVNIIGRTTNGDVNTGNWPPDTPVILLRLNQMVQIINQPSTPAIQALPQNQWVLHPLLDGCQESIIV
jgi:hypothetical protein